MSTFAAAALRRARIPTLSNEGGAMLDHDLDLGTACLTSHFGTARDIRAALEVRSSDPIRTAFWTLVAPSRPWLAKLMNDDEIEELGAVALDRYIETLSVAASDYSDLLDQIADPFSYEWQPGCRTPSPSGCST